MCTVIYMPAVIAYTIFIVIMPFGISMILHFLSADFYAAISTVYVLSAIYLYQMLQVINGLISRCIIVEVKRFFCVFMLTVIYMSAFFTYAILSINMWALLSVFF